MQLPSCLRTPAAVLIELQVRVIDRGRDESEKAARALRPTEPEPERAKASRKRRARLPGAPGSSLRARSKGESSAAEPSSTCSPGPAFKKKLVTLFKFDTKMHGLFA